MNNLIKIFLILLTFSYESIAGEIIVCDLKDGMTNKGTVSVLKDDYAIRIAPGKNIDNYGLLDFKSTKNVVGGNESKIIKHRNFEKLGLDEEKSSQYLDGKKRLYAPVGGIGIITVDDEIYEEDEINGVPIVPDIDKLYEFIYTKGDDGKDHNDPEEAVVLINSFRCYKMELKQPEEKEEKDTVFCGIANEPPEDSPYQFSCGIVVEGNFNFVCDNSKYTQKKFTFQNSQSDLQIAKAVPQSDIDVKDNSELTFSLSEETGAKEVEFTKTLNVDETSNVTIGEDVTFSALSGSVLNFGI